MKNFFVSAAIFSVMFGGCFLNPQEHSDGASLTSKYLIVTTADFFTGGGNVSKVALSDYSVGKDLLTIHPDNGVVTHNGSTFLVERGGPDNIIKFNGAAISADSLVYQQSIGTAVNIHDLAIESSTKAYILQYAKSSIAIFNPQTHAVTDSIVLSGSPYVYDGETVPYMDKALIANNKLYVTIQRLKVTQGLYGPAPTFVDSTGMIVVISTVTNKVISTIKLNKGNPASMDTANGYLYVSSTGDWTISTDGGIERINMSTNFNEGVIISESDFKGNISKIKIVNSSKAYVCVADASWKTNVVECNLNTKTVGSAITGISDAFGGLAYDGTYLFIGDRDAAKPGVFVINPLDNSTVTGPINVGSFAPSDIAVLYLPE